MTGRELATFLEAQDALDLPLVFRGFVATADGDEDNWEHVLDEAQVDISATEVTLRD